MDNFLKKYIYLDAAEFYLISSVRLYLIIPNFVTARGRRKIKSSRRFNARKHKTKLERMLQTINVQKFPDMPHKVLWRHSTSDVIERKQLIPWKVCFYSTIFFNTKHVNFITLHQFNSLRMSKKLILKIHQSLLLKTRPSSYCQQK